MIKEKLIWVKQQLILNPKLRDSNELLYYTYLKSLGYDVTKSTKEFLQDMEKRKIPYIDTISRVSRRVQEENVDLRGKTYKKRKIKEVEIKEEIRELNQK